MSTPGGDAMRWAPELVLAVASFGEAATFLGQARTAAARLALCTLATLGIDAALGAAEYAGLGGQAVSAAHSNVTALFKSIGLAGALATIVLCLPRLSDRTRRAAGVVTGTGALLASFALPLTPLLLAAHVVSGAAGSGPRARTTAFASAAALAIVISTQLLLPETDVRLAALHLGLAAWAAAFSAYVRAAPGLPERPPSPHADL